MRALYLVLAIVLMASPAQSADETEAAKALIRSQVDAISKDDAAAAYAFASPGIQGIFPKSDVFLAMVKDRYPRSIVTGSFRSAMRAKKMAR